MKRVSRSLKVKGIHCSGCEQAIEEAVGSLPGVQRVKASHDLEAVEVLFDDGLIRLDGIVSVIEGKGYILDQGHASSPARKLFNGLIFLVLLLVLGGITFWGKGQMGLLDQLDARMDYAVLLGIGFLTGFHCIGMCGGFVVSYAITDKPRKTAARILAHLAYAFGRTVSYTALGAVFGALGAMVAITPDISGAAASASGMFLILFGLKMLDVFSGLRRVGLRMPAFVTRTVSGGMRGQRNPLVIGLLTGFLLGCGPLQAMYVLAAGTGSPLEGTKILFFFGLGTLPPLLGFGFFANLLSRGAMHQIVRVSGILVIAMGLMMTNRGLKISQSGYDLASLMTHWQLNGAPANGESAGHPRH